MTMRCSLTLKHCLIPSLMVIAMTAWPQGAGAMTLGEATDTLLKQLREGNAPGETLFAEDFEAGTLDDWRADAGCSVVDRGNDAGKCGQIVASENDHEDLILKQHIPIVPGHPIAVCWKARFMSGRSPLFLRVDYFDESGKQGKPYARQQQFAQGDDWTQNVLLVSEWFPQYARAITIHFHHIPGAKTTSRIDDIRVVDLAQAAGELLAQELAKHVKTSEELARQMSDLPDSPVSRYWKDIIAARLPRISEELKACGELEPGSDDYEKALRGTATQIRRFAEVLEALRKGSLTTTRVMTYHTQPITSTMVLPWTPNLPGSIAAEIELTASPGEYEPASLVLWAPDGLRNLTLTASDLRGAAGAIPAASVDIKWVKCWYQGGNAPYGIPVVRDRKALIPELLLNDDSLVKVDYADEHNYLKLSFPEGAKYVSTDDPTVVPWGNRYALHEFPVKDSPTLLPTDLPAGDNKQVWITVQVPELAAPGRYTGRLAISAEGKDLGEIALALEVLPFKLPTPKTHYNLNEHFTYSLYYWGELDPQGHGTIGYELKSEEQFRAELQYMYDHGIVAPAMIWSPKWVYGDEAFFRRHLAIAQEIGMADRPLYFADSGLVRNPTEPEALEELKRNVRKAIEIAKEYDFTGVYFYAIDEARGDVLNSQRKAWQAVQEAGGKIIVSGYAGHLDAVGDILDLLNWAGPPERARPAEWHKRGNRIWNYANPQTPVEDPAIYRRNYGLLLWKRDFDGACTYCFMDSEGRPWNDFDGKSYRNHNVAYPTVNGVVGTLALEGFREGVDDVKYATTLQLEIEKALKSGPTELKQKAVGAREWLASIDAKHGDLDAIREELIRRILELRGHHG